jgi:predicted Zn-dependent protease
MGFTRGDEEQADEWGFKFFTRAGWDPRHFSDFFKAMIAAGYDKTPEYLSDHPTLKNRVDHINQWVQDLDGHVDQYLRGPIASPAKFRELQQRANQIAKNTPDDQSIQNSQQLAAALPHSCVMPADPPEAKAAREEIDKRSRAAAAARRRAANQ